MSIYTQKINKLDGTPLDLNELKGNVLLIVNTASKCGFTPQYQQLQELHTKYAKQGLTIIGFPCNQFGGQEPGGADEIQTFCQKNYGVDFLMTEKIDVNGDDAHPIYEYLKEKAPGLLGSKMIKWNFTKFLVGPNESSFERFAPKTSPAEIEERIQELLPQANS